MTISDLHVERESDALSGLTLDVVVSGSIGAVESVRFIRALRRLGAKVVPWLTRGGAQFVTETALSWAADHPVRVGFNGTESHLAQNDGLIIAPASASLIGKIVHGITDSPAAAVATSYLGRDLPVIVLPNMHDSLASAKAVMRNVEMLHGLGARMIPAREEEGKRKFPDPEVAAAIAAHQINFKRRSGSQILVTMGTTRGYLDDVRYVSNYSSGGLGTLIAEDLYRHGHLTHVVAGPSLVRPKVAETLQLVDTNDEMAKAIAKAMSHPIDAAIVAASVLDYVPAERAKGKIKSGSDNLTVSFVNTPKLIGTIHPSKPVKVGFKLEAQLDLKEADAIARDYMKRYDLSFFVLNGLRDVSLTSHKAIVFESKATGSPDSSKHVTGKRDVAMAVVSHVNSRLQSNLSVLA